MYTILGVIARPLGWLLDLMYGFISNYGITVIAFTLIVKLCLYPLYIKQTKSTVKTVSYTHLDVYKRQMLSFII